VTADRPEPGRGERELLERFRRRGALLEGHFLLSSGLHSPVYLQSALVLQHPREAEALGRRLARAVWSALGGGEGSGGPSLVVAPALGGIVIGHELARALGARSIFAEREAGRMTLRRGFAVEPGEAAIVCEDVITTGGSAAEVLSLVRESGGRVAAAAALVHRGDDPAPFDVPLVTLARIRASAHPPESCPGCAAGEPLVKPGSRGTSVPAAL
jgi:orotate phosphoribosyltransferase